MSLRTTLSLLALCGGLTAVISESAANFVLPDIPSINESRCRIDVNIDGLVAVAKTRLDFKANGVQSLSVYQFRLPADAVIVDLDIHQSGHASSSRAMSIAADEGRVTAPNGAKPDVAVLRRTDRGKNVDDDYELELAPFATSEIVTITWVVQLTMSNNVVHLPLRQSNTRLPMGTEVSVSVRSQSLGANVQQMRIGDRVIASDHATFALSPRSGIDDVAISLKFANDQPKVLHHTETVGGCVAHLVTAIVPRVEKVANATPKRMLVVLDGSKSMDGIGRAPIADLVDTIAATLDRNSLGSRIQVAVYDRKVSMIWSQWQSNNDSTRAELRKSLLLRPAGNGSDPDQAALKAALVVSDALSQASDAVDVVWITDGAFAIDDAGMSPLLPHQNIRLHVVIVNEHGDVKGTASDNAKSGTAILTTLVGNLGGSIHHVSLGAMLKTDVDGPLATTAIQIARGGDWSDVRSQRPSPLLQQQIPSTIVAGTAPTLALFWSCPKLGRHKPTQLDVTARENDTTIKLAETSTTARVAALLGDGADIVERESAVDESDNDTQPKFHPRNNVKALTPDNLFVVADTSTAAGRSRASALATGTSFVQFLPTVNADSVRRFAAEPSIKVGTAVVLPQTLIPENLKRIFQQQLLPRAAVCYRREIATSDVRNVVQGSAKFELVLGRGEVAHAEVEGLTTSTSTFRNCLLDAAYALDIPMPADIDGFDELIVAHYPLAFSMVANQATIVPGDADGPDAIDIEKIAPFDPGLSSSASKKPKPIKVHAETPLGGLRLMPPTP
jgi:hypothetical protein